LERIGYTNSRDLFLGVISLYPWPMRFLFLAAAFLSLVAPVYAAQTEWQQVAPDVSIRLVSTGQVSAAGHTRIGIDIDMPSGTKTYWRVPGETGLAPDLAFSAGIQRADIVWPHPSAEVKSGYTDFVYHGPTLLPVDLTVAPGTRDLDLALTLGICAEVCIPARANFTLSLADTSPDRANSLRIRQAAAFAPLPWDGAEQPIRDIAVSEDGKALRLTVDPDLLYPATIIAATPSGKPLFGAPQKNPEGDLVLLPILGKSTLKDLENQELAVTFLTDLGAYEVKLNMSPALME
jgi:DsbC/DsbD-like thiol-disulfide interchange protein